MLNAQLECPAEYPSSGASILDAGPAILTHSREFDIAIFEDLEILAAIAAARLAGIAGDAANAVLAGAGYNFSLLVKWLRDFLRQLLAALAVPAQSHFAHARA